MYCYQCNQTYSPLSYSCNNNIPNLCNSCQQNNPIPSPCQSCSDLTCLSTYNSECVVYNGDGISCLSIPIVTGQGLNDVINSLASQICLAQQGGGSVTSFSTSNLVPLFMATVDTATTTPNLIFAQIPQNAFTFFAGPATGTPDNPTFRDITFNDISAAIAQPDMQVVYGKTTVGIASDANFIWDYTNLNLTVGDLSSVKCQMALSIDNIIGSAQLESDLGTISVVGSLGTYTRTPTNGIIVDSKNGHYTIGNQLNGGTYIDINNSTGKVTFNLATDGSFGTNAYSFPIGKATSANSVLTDVAGNGTLSWQVQTGAPQTVKITLSSAQFLALHSSPVQIVPAPATGYFTQVLALVVNYHFLTAAYVTNNGFSIIYGNAPDLYAAIINQTFTQQTYSSSQVVPVGINDAGHTTLSNQALYLYADGNNPTTGSGSFDIYLTYLTLPL